MVGEEDALISDYADSHKISSLVQPDKVELLARSKHLFKRQDLNKTIEQRFVSFKNYHSQVQQLSVANKFYQNEDDFLDDEVNEEDVCFWVDPLDGTGGFVKGHTEHVTCNIGISVKGKPLFGVIGKPFMDSHYNLSATFVGGLNVGFHQILNMHVSHYSNNKTKTLTVSTKPKYMGPFQNIMPCSPVICAAINKNQTAMNQIFDMYHPKAIERVAGAGNKFVHLSTGKSDLYLNFVKGMAMWDTCAGDALIKSRFGFMANSNLEHIYYDPGVSNYTL